MTSTSNLSAVVPAHVYLRAFPPQRLIIFSPDLPSPVRGIAVSFYGHHTDPAYPPGPAPSYPCFCPRIRLVPSRCNGNSSQSSHSFVGVNNSCVLHQYCTGSSMIHTPWRDRCIYHIDYNHEMQLSHLPVGVKGRRISTRWTSTLFQ